MLKIALEDVMTGLANAGTIANLVKRDLGEVLVEGCHLWLYQSGDNIVKTRPFRR